MKQTRTSIYIATVDAQGEMIPGRDKELISTPLSMLYSDTPVIFIDWLAAGKAPQPEDLRRPFHALGLEWNPYRCWGSSIKTGITIGVPVDKVDELTHLQKECEAGHRWSRAYLAQGTFGAGFGEVEIVVCKPGTRIDGHIIDDGFGLITRELADELYYGGDKIELRDSWDSWQFAQRIPWTEPVQAEVEQKLDEVREMLIEPSSFAFAGTQYLKGIRKWLEHEPELINHPRIANTLARSTKRLLYTRASSIPTNTQAWVAVPATQYTLEKDAIVYGYPIDSWAMISVHKACTDEKEIERVAKLEVIQYSFTSQKRHIKGMAGIIERPGHILYVCSEDIKMGAKSKGVHKDEGALSIMQWYGKGCAMGCPKDDWQKKKSRDWDGDNVFTAAVEGNEAIAAEVANFPVQVIPKLVKSHLPVAQARDICPRMIVRSMKNLVGLATVVAGWTFMLEDREQMAQLLQFASVKAMDDWFSIAIKTGTDLYKTFLLMIEQPGRKAKMLNMDYLEERLLRMQGRIIGAYRYGAPWTSWRRSSMAFAHTVPQVLDHEAMDIWYQDSVTTRKMLREQILPHHTGTVAQIARRILPDIATVIGVGDRVFAWPLTTFVNWANTVPPKIQERADELQSWWIGQTKRINWTNGNEVYDFQQSWEYEIASAIAELEIDEWLMANAIWRSAHLNKGLNATGASIFYCLHDQVVRIVTEKPGLKQQFNPETVFTGIGLEDNVVDPPDTYTGPGTFIAVEDVVRNKKVIRPVLVGVPGIRCNGAEDLVMVFDLRKPQPPLGTYQIHWERFAQYRAWHVWLLGGLDDPQ